MRVKQDCDKGREFDSKVNELGRVVNDNAVVEGGPGRSIEQRKSVE